MKKQQFINLVTCVMSGILFSIGMCMCLLQEWNLFDVGVVMASLGGVTLISICVYNYIKTAKHKWQINWKLVGKITYATISTLIMGLGMSMILVWSLYVWGILVSVLGIIMLLFLIPMFVKLEK